MDTSTRETVSSVKPIGLVTVNMAKDSVMPTREADTLVAVEDNLFLGVAMMLWSPLCDTTAASSAGDS